MEHDHQHAKSVIPEEAEAAKDPVCGMTVAIGPDTRHAPGDIAMRYVVGIGRPELYEVGDFYIGAKKEWPNWTPTPDMIRREPKAYAKFADGLEGGLNHPLTAGLGGSPRGKP